MIGLSCLKDPGWIPISRMFGAALVNTEESAVSVFQGLVFWREGLDTDWGDHHERSNMIVRAGAQGKVKDGRDCMMKKTSEGQGSSLS